jgi:prepilin-type N-terminal cleavage/methylation domain-containing protein
MKSFKKQAGFTLVEIAIVLVIVGLLLAGVLKGQELIESSRIKAIATDVRGIQAAFNGYVDRFRAIPGDELAATMTNRGWAGVAGAAAADGTLVIAANQTFNNGGEQAGFWRALRASGLIAGNPAAPATVDGLPRHSGGGLMGVTNGVWGMAGPSICVANLTTAQAAGLDAMIDGPLPADQIGNNLGEVRAIRGAANVLPTVIAGGPAASVYNNTVATTNWTVCVRMQ